MACCQCAGNVKQRQQSEAFTFKAEASTHHAGALRGWAWGQTGSYAVGTPAQLGCVCGSKFCQVSPSALPCRCYDSVVSVCTVYPVSVAVIGISQSVTLAARALECSCD